MNLQEHYIKKALSEGGLNKKVNSIDHHNGGCTIDGQKYSLLFPISLVELCRNIDVERDIDFFFRGMMTENRSWCNQYTERNGIIENNLRGRDPKLKWSYDVEYYTMLNRTKFALTPLGECPYSYRIHEAVMCGAIPVLGHGEIDVTNIGYKTYTDGENMWYDENIVEHNYTMFMKYHTINVLTS